MHSMLRQNQVRAQDVKPYIRAFTRNNPLDLGEWAKEEGSLFDPGTLVFLLEPAKKPPGMTSFARGQQGAQEVTQDAYRVKDMCVVVDKIDGKCYVLAISPSAFELRYIDTLFREKAQKSFLEGIDFNYLAAQPRPGLSPEKLKDLRQLSTLYSKSGSRRTMAQDDSAPEEPAKAMLAFLGADLGPNASKQVMELGLICNLIFAPEGEQENRAQSAVKACFTPILSTDKLKGQAPPPPPSTAQVVENRDLINEEVSLLTQAYLANEAQEAEEYIKYAPPPADAPAVDASQSSGVWTSNPAAASQATSADDFKPLTPPPPFDMGSFPSPTSSGVQPSLSLSPDIPSILTGDHPVISIDQKLNAKSSNGQSDAKVPSMPAWYLTTHDVNEMNQVALKRAAEAPRLPEGLKRLEVELSYDALPVVDARFRQGEEAPPAEEFTPAPAAAQSAAPAAAAPQTFSEQFSVDMAQGEAGLPPTSSKVEPSQVDASGSWPGGTVSGGEPEKDFVDKIFESSGSKGTIEANAQAQAQPAEPQPAAPKDWQPVNDRPAPSTAFVSPGSLANPQPQAEPPKDTNLFDRLAPGAQAAEEASTPSWADGGRGGIPTNLKDMLTADSAVFSTSGGGKFPDMPKTDSEFSPADVPTTEPPSGFNMGADNSPFARPATTPPADPGATAGSVMDDSGPAPWMNLPHHAPAADVSQTTSPEPVSSAPDNYNELETALSGLMDSSEATAAAPTEPVSAQTGIAPAEPEPAAVPESQPDLFGDVIDKVIDLAETPEPEVQAKPEPDHDFYQDNRDQTMDLDAAMLQKLASGPARLTAPEPAPEVVSSDVAAVTPPASIPSFDTPSLVSPAMATHAQAMAEPVSDPTVETGASSLDATANLSTSPEPTATVEPTESGQTASSDLTPIRPGRSRYRRGVPPRVTPEESAEPAAQEPIEDAPAAEVQATVDETSPEPLSTLAPAPDLSSPATASEPPAVEPEPLADTPTAAASAEPSSTLAPAAEPQGGLFSGISAAATVEPAAPVAPVVEPAGDLFSGISRPPAEPEPSTDLFGEISPPLATEPAITIPEPPTAATEPAITIPEPPAAATTASEAFFSTPEPAIPVAETTPVVDETPVVSTPTVPTTPASAKDDIFPSTISQDSAAPVTSTPTPPPAEPVVSFEDSGVFLAEKDDDKPAPYGLDLKPLSASGLQRAQPSVEPKLVISESTRFMARLNQRLSEADKKLSSRCDQSRDRLNRELDALLDDARKIERQNELSTGTLTEQLVQHLETISEEVKAKVAKTSNDAREEIQQLIKYAEDNIEQMHKDMLKELEMTESKFQTETNSMSESTRANLNDHAQNRLTDFNKKLEEITASLEAVYTHHANVLLARYGKFETRLNEEFEAIVTSLDRNVGSMTVEIDGSWDRASEKLTASQAEFGNSVNYLVHSCRADIKQVHLDLYAKQVLPRLLENKDIFRSMLLDMKRNFEEQSEKIRRSQLGGLTNRIDDAKDQLNTLTKECLSTIESVGKGQQFGLEDLFKSTNTRLEEIITTVESRLKTAKQQIVDNDEACMKTSESSRVEDEPAFSKEKQQAIAALNECRTKADNALETHISSSCLDLEQLSENLQEDLAKQRQDWTAQVRTTADESIMQVKQAVQDAFQAIETAKEKHME